MEWVRDMFKRMVAVILIALLLCGCAKTESVEPVSVVSTSESVESIETEPEVSAEIEEPETVELTEEEKLAAQIAVAEQVIDEYSEDLDDLMREHCFCTLTDFDQNGRLEIVLASCVGSGRYTYFAIYEVNDDYKTAKILEEFDYRNYNESESAPDIIIHEWQGVYDPESDTYKYYLWDNEVEGARIACARLKELSFGEKKGIKNYCLGITRDEIDPETGLLVSQYYDAEHNEISKKEYEKRIADLKDSYNVAYAIGWEWLGNLQEDKDSRAEKLTELYKWQNFELIENDDSGREDLSDENQKNGSVLTLNDVIGKYTQINWYEFYEYGKQSFTSSVWDYLDHYNEMMDADYKFFDPFYYDFDRDGVKDVIFVNKEYPTIEFFVTKKGNDYYGAIYHGRQAVGMFSNGIILSEGGIGEARYYRVKVVDGKWVEEELASSDYDYPEEKFTIGGETVSRNEFEAWVEENCKVSVFY